MFRSLLQSKEKMYASGGLFYALLNNTLLKQQLYLNSHRLSVSLPSEGLEEGAREQKVTVTALSNDAPTV
jgi:hypothetical protein